MDQDEPRPIGVWLLHAKSFSAVERRNDRVQGFNFGVLQSAVFVRFKVDWFEKLRKWLQIRARRELWAKICIDAANRLRISCWMYWIRSPIIRAAGWASFGHRLIRPNIATKSLGQNYFRQYIISTECYPTFGESLNWAWLRSHHSCRQCETSHRSKHFQILPGTSLRNGAASTILIVLSALWLLLVREC
jgi:hypothetical protein